MIIYASLGEDALCDSTRMRLFVSVCLHSQYSSIYTFFCQSCCCLVDCLHYPKLQSWSVYTKQFISCVFSTVQIRNGLVVATNEYIKKQYLFLPIPYASQLNVGIILLFLGFFYFHEDRVLNLHLQKGLVHSNEQLETMQWYP